MTKHVLVTGGAGQVGLSMQALGNDALVLHTPDRKHLDLMSDVSIRDVCDVYTDTCSCCRLVNVGNIDFVTTAIINW